MKLIDSHCHLDAFRNYKEIIKISKDKLEALITCGYSRESNDIAVKISKEYEGYVFPIVGIAPQTAMKMKGREWEIKIPEEAIAIGEIGLDFHWAKTSEEKYLQRECFNYFLKIAEETDMPVVIHSREAYDEVINILSEYKIRNIIFHCFTGEIRHAMIAREKGWILSFPPIPSKNRREVAKLDVKLIVETDAPYIGKFPWDVIKSIEFIAESKNVKIEKIENDTIKNTREVFRI